MDRAASASCSSCGTTLPASSRFCPSCGAGRGDLLAASAPTLPDTPRPGPAAHGPAPVSMRPSQQRNIASAADPLIGQVIADRYKILSMLGRGGMGVVYKVEHVHIGKLMAMKLLSGELAADVHTVRRFRREAKAISKLTHPNTVQIFDFGQSAKLAYLVMEYLPGKDFATLIAEESPLSFTRVAKICAQVAASVAEAHDRGIIHRDIKPENVMIVEASGQRDMVKVLDFGIAKLRDTEDGAIATQSGHLLGTPYYMAPEQIRAEPYDHRIDIYALGAMMYKGLAGVPPFEADTPMGVLSLHLTEPLVPVSVRSQRTDLPAVADEIIARAMAKNPKDRYPRMDDLRLDLLAYLGEVGALDTTDNLVMRSRSLDLSRTSLNEVATRGDIDRYESKLSRKGWFASVLAVLAVSAVLFAGYKAWGHRPNRVQTSEVEPNDDPLHANPLRPGQPLQGLLGKRQSVTYGDADVYQLEVPLNQTRVARIEVSALPNMDLVLDLVRKGEGTPLLIADTGRFAEAESIPNFALRGGSYHVRVREQWEGGRMPTENVSDPYTISLRLSTLAPGDEREPNDSFDAAEKVTQPEERHGYLGWTDDRDLYCLDPALLPARVSVGPVGSLDIALKTIDRATDATQVVDEHGAGEGESVDVRAVAPGNVCVELSVRADPEAQRGDAKHLYNLGVLRL